MRGAIDPVAGIRQLGVRLLTLQMHDLDAMTPQGTDVPWGQARGGPRRSSRNPPARTEADHDCGLEYSKDFDNNLSAVAQCASTQPTHSETESMSAPPTTPGATAPALDPSFDALAKYDRGSGRETLKPIDAAVMAAPKDPELRADLEVRLAAVLRGPASAVAKEYACGKLALVGGPGAVAALAGLLSNAGLSHPAADALQRLACVEAATALRESLTKLSGLPLVGAITALGARRDSATSKR